MLRSATGGGEVIQISADLHYEGACFNVISVMRGGSRISRKKHYITLEWPLIDMMLLSNVLVPINSRVYHCPSTRLDG